MHGDLVKLDTVTADAVRATWPHMDLTPFALDPMSDVWIAWVHGVLEVGFPSGPRITQIHFPIVLHRHQARLGAYRIVWNLLRRAMASVERTLEAGFVVCRRGGRKKARPLTSYRWLSDDDLNDPRSLGRGWQ